MMYMGGKSRLAKQIATVILDRAPTRARYAEPFIGGGAVFSELAPHFDYAAGSDTHEDLMLMWQALADGWTPPGDISEEEWRTLKTAEPSALRGFAGFGCSFGGKWFDGYARNSKADNFAGMAQRSTAKWVNKTAETELRLYRSHYASKVIQPGDVIYCDPPYANSKEYIGQSGFDTEVFWDYMDSWYEQGAHVFVSERVAPPHWEVVWEKSRRLELQHDASLRRPVMERLFTRVQPDALAEGIAA